MFISQCCLINERQAIQQKKCVHNIYSGARNPCSLVELVNWNVDSEHVEVIVR